jgi:hypothetical protein
MTVTSVQIQNGNYTENYKSFNERTLPNKVMVNMQLTKHIVQLQDSGIDIDLRGRKASRNKRTIGRCVRD